MKISLTFVIWLTLGSFSQAQPVTRQFEETDSLMNSEKRCIVIFIHSDWCRYCQIMKNTTFRDHRIIDLLNEKFYFIDMNGEEKRTITFQEKKFCYKPTGINTGVHELAVQLAGIDGRLSYPSICILNTDYEILFQYDQMLSANELLKILDLILEKENDIPLKKHD